MCWLVSGFFFCWTFVHFNDAVRLFALVGDGRGGEGGCGLGERSIGAIR